MLDHPIPATRDALPLLEQRRSVEPPFLGEPGPTDEELQRLLAIAARVPDHGILVPWRFLLIRGAARERLSEAVASDYAASVAGDADAGKQEKLRRVFTYAPLIVGVVSTADPAARKPEWEQVLTAGAVCMNLTIAANAMGFSSVWLTGFPAYDPASRARLGIADGERVAGFIHVGTASKRPGDRKRPDIAAITTELA